MHAATNHIEWEFDFLPSLAESTPIYAHAAARPDSSAHTALIERIVKEDRQALAELYHLFAGVLYSLALKILQDPLEAEEVLQDTFVRVWKQARRYDSQRGSVFAWLVTICRSLCLDRLRWRRSNPYRGRNYLPIDLAPQSVDHEHEGPLFVHFRSNLGREIGEKLKELSPEQRECIELAYFQGYTQQEIARLTKEPLGTIKARLRRAIIRLRALLPPL